MPSRSSTLLSLPLERTVPPVEDESSFRQERFGVSFLRIRDVHLFRPHHAYSNQDRSPDSASPSKNPISDPEKTTQSSFDYDVALSQLRSKYFPSDEEKQIILSNASTRNKEVGFINDELRKLTDFMTHLETRRSEMEKQTTYELGLLSPIRSLPNEILVEIFEFCSGGQVDVCAPTSEIWTIGKVCKRWQLIVLSTPALWSSINIYMGNLNLFETTLPIKQVSHLVKLCLERSRNLSLSINFLEIGDHSFFLELFYILAMQSHRWESLSFSMAMLETCPDLVKGLARLKSLNLSGSYRSEVILDAFLHAPELSRLRLYSVTSPSRLLALPWRQLTYFKILYCEFKAEEYIELFQHMPNLVICVYKWNKGLPKNFPQESIYLRYFKSLEIEASAAEICALVQILTTPLLCELWLVNAGSFTTPIYLHIAHTVSGFIRRSHCFITTLGLSGLDSDCVYRILAETPNLTYLELGYISEIEIILRQLSFPNHLVPILEDFALMCKENQGTAAVGPLTEILRKRSPRNRPRGWFRSLVITLRGEKGVEPFANLLKPLSLENGISIVIHSLP